MSAKTVAGAIKMACTKADAVKIVALNGFFWNWLGGWPEASLKPKTTRRLAKSEPRRDQEMGQPAARLVTCMYVRWSQESCPTWVDRFSSLQPTGTNSGMPAAGVGDWRRAWVPRCDRPGFVYRAHRRAARGAHG